jgi:hypothetical protein
MAYLRRDQRLANGLWLQVRLRPGPIGCEEKTSQQATHADDPKGSGDGLAGRVVATTTAVQRHFPLWRLWFWMVRMRPRSCSPLAQTRDLEPDEKEGRHPAGRRPHVQPLRGAGCAGAERG